MHDKYWGQGPFLASAVFAGLVVGLIIGIILRLVT